MIERRKKVKKDCANYNSKEGICMLRDTSCPLIEGFTYNGYKVPEEEIQCDYFNKYVDPKAKEVKIEEPTKRYSQKDCLICGTRFPPKSSVSKYCSVKCRELAKKRKYRKYNSTRKDHL